MLAPRFSLHGTLLDMCGIGTPIRGKSGVGKSECALALIERNHSLVADDMVDIRLVSEHDLIGRIPDMRWWGFMECRGIGIINIRDLFGIRAVRQEKRIDFIITFTYWKQGMEEERTGLTQDYEELQVFVFLTWKFQFGQAEIWLDKKSLQWCRLKSFLGMIRPRTSTTC